MEGNLLEKLDAYLHCKLMRRLHEIIAYIMSLSMKIGYRYLAE